MTSCISGLVQCGFAASFVTSDSHVVPHDLSSGGKDSEQETQKGAVCYKSAIGPHCHPAIARRSARTLLKS
jgi:hypothetical protein